MRPTNQSPVGTSFHQDTFFASVSQIREICGVPDYAGNDGADKVNFEWLQETEAGDVFTIYDWKEYRKLNEKEILQWHIGGHEKFITTRALKEISEALILSSERKS